MITTKNYSYGLKPSKKRVSAQRVVSNVILYALMTALAIVLLVPYLYMINRSLMTADNAKYSYDFFTKDWMFSNFKTLFYDNTVEGNSANPLAYLSGLKWTIIIIAFNLVAVPLSSSFIAYSFAKLKWTGRNVMFFLMLGTMMLPAAVTQLPLYVMYSQNGIFGNGGFNWLDTIYPFTIPNLFGGGAVYIFLTRQFMLGIPKDFDEAAKIDGANTFQRYLFITLPLCQPVLLYVMSQVFISYWGDYYGPMVYCDGEKIRTLAQVVYYSTNSTDRVGSIKDNIVMAGAVFMSIIPTIIFAIFQKQLIEGVSMSGIKG
ncbi:binding-protein-dependent transport systems inner membrane component [Acidiphilium sp. CAG:727]|nr:binding-protein-dependent transport systems inner membrane component [Acidiphilium sp. CAG:727]